MTLEALSGLVELFSMADIQYTQCPPMVIDPAKQYEAVMKTSKGEVVLNLYADKAPLAVNSFVFLAQRGWFDNVSFHRVLPGFVAQGGDPTGSGMGGPGYQFQNENLEAVFDRAGLLAMANSGADTNGSQFFITYAETPDLNGGYTIFGEVTKGMEIVESLTERDPSSGAELPDPDLILSIKITEK
jgi:cyclophilin family peptidyl-prolyl cis-trans isomerase